MELLLKAIDTAVWELGEGFKGMPDEDLWKRPHPRLLSVGELAAHMVYGEVESFFGKDFESPLLNTTVRYYPYSVETPFTLDMTAEAVYEEVKRVHAACKASFEANPHEASEPNPHRQGWTWGNTLEYMAFHFAYHTGQLYSVRHLLGHETEDN